MDDRFTSFEDSSGMIIHHVNGSGLAFDVGVTPFHCQFRFSVDTPVDAARLLALEWSAKCRRMADEECVEWASPIEAIDWLDMEPRDWADSDKEKFYCMACHFRRSRTPARFDFRKSEEINTPDGKMLHTVVRYEALVIDVTLQSGLFKLTFSGPKMNIPESILAENLITDILLDVPYGVPSKITVLDAGYRKYTYKYEIPKDTTCRTLS